MFTLKAEIVKEKLRNDGTYNVKIRFTKDRKVKRLSTNLFISKEDVDSNFQIKEDTASYNKAMKLVLYYRDLYDRQSSELEAFSVSDIVKRLLDKEEEDKPIDFFQFADDWIKHATIKGKADYQTAVNALKRYYTETTLNMNSINSSFIKGFIDFLNKEREVRNKKLKEQGKYIAPNPASTKYLISIRKLFNEAKKKYNNREQNITRIKTMPFENIEFPKAKATRKRAISVDKIREIWNLPYKNKGKGIRNTCRFDLAKDCFLLSFCLIGINSVDLYHAKTIEGNKLIYDRSKTKDRRRDKARMEVEIPPMIQPLVEKYKDSTGERLLKFHLLYANHKAFNKTINLGLKQIGEVIGIEDLEFYAARHSWATIAINKIKIDKYTVHSALNHIDPSMRVTDIYIERDFSNENAANKKVIKYVFGKWIDKK